jgi:hypothetical protein
MARHGDRISVSVGDKLRTRVLHRLVHHSGHPASGKRMRHESKAGAMRSELKAVAAPLPPSLLQPVAVR